MYLNRMLLLLLLSCTILAIAPKIAAVAEDTAGPAEYHAAAEMLGQPVFDSLSSSSIQGYRITVCHAAGGYIVIALPKNQEMLGLVRWTNGEVFNLYLTQQPWFEDWPLNFALSHGKKGKAWLNAFTDFAPRKFVWWENQTKRVISQTLLQDGVQYGGTISVGSQIFSMLPRWNKDTATNYELSRELAVF